jgi:hypothetical protein
VQEITQKSVEPTRLARTRDPRSFWSPMGNPAATTDIFALALGHFERWSGDDPFAVFAGIRLLERGVEEIDRSGSIDPLRWARLLESGTRTLARLIDLSANGDERMKERASDGVRALAPILGQMAGDTTNRLAKGWRSA